MVSARRNFWTQVTDSDSTNTPDLAIGKGKVMEMNIKGLCFPSLQFPQLLNARASCVKAQPFLPPSKPISFPRITDLQHQKSTKPREGWDPHPPQPSLTMFMRVRT